MRQRDPRLVTATEHSQLVYETMATTEAAQRTRSDPADSSRIARAGKGMGKKQRLYILMGHTTWASSGWASVWLRLREVDSADRRLRSRVRGKQTRASKRNIGSSEKRFLGLRCRGGVRARAAYLLGMRSVSGVSQSQQAECAATSVSAPRPPGQLIVSGKRLTVACVSLLHQHLLPLASSSRESQY